MAGKFQFTPEDYQQAAIKYRPELLYLPILGINETLQFMTGRPGIRYAERVGQASADAQFAPYDPTNVTNADLKVAFRELRTQFGSVVADFEPNTAISTLLGHSAAAAKGDSQIQTPTAKHVLALIAKGLSGNLNKAVWNGKRNASGKTTKDLFDGFDTITEQEIANGEIAADKGNYVKVTKAITPANVVDVLKKAMFAMDPNLRAEDCNIYCSQELVDMYNEGYQMLHGALPYNTEYNKNTLEGSNGRLHFVPLTNKAGSNFIHISPKSNMLVGYDQMGDVESVAVKEYKPFILSYVATMFFGVQFESIDKSRLMVLDITDAGFEWPAAAE
ncbi:MAG: hypothetical protein NC301_07465 [Bacteroides sp.]|nr:hypothetical protein [Bacteroides sp.]MCM1379995.1 hypothetical protein [Bacteroides sp.]MCM1446325.1 hypothetical protein [Prevotella sp.]